MSEENQYDESSEDVPFFQKLLDNHFLLVIIGVLMPTVFYILWGLIEIMMIPPATY